MNSVCRLFLRFLHRAMANFSGIMKLATEPESWLIALCLSLLGDGVQLDKLSLAEALLSILVLTAIRGVWLIKDQVWWSEALSGQIDGFSTRLSFMERRDMYRYLQGHEFVRQLRNWFYEYDSSISGTPWFLAKLASELSLWRQAVSVRLYAQSPAVFSEA